MVARPLDDESYLRLLRDSDVLLLPYHLEKYRDRTSGVFCEAMTAGKPVITTEGSFPGLEVQREGTGWLARDDDPDLPGGRQSGARSRTGRRRCALLPNLMPHYKPMFHPDTFVSQLLGSRR